MADQSEWMEEEGVCLSIFERDSGPQAVSVVYVGFPSVRACQARRHSREEQGQVCIARPSGWHAMQCMLKEGEMKVAVRETRASSFTSQGGGAAEESRRIDASLVFAFDFPAGPLTCLLMASLCIQV